MRQRRSPVAAGDNTITFTGGGLNSNLGCTIAINVTSSLGASASAEAMLTVTPTVAPEFSSVFSPATIDQGGISTLTFTIDNSDNRIALASLGFEDVFPEGLVVAPEPNVNNGCGGAFSPVAGEGALSLRGGEVAAGESCTIALEVQALRFGTLENTSGALFSDLSFATAGATAALMVNQAPLAVSMAFAPAAITGQGVTRLSYDLTNNAVIGATEVVLFDTLPAAVALAAVPNAQTSCDGGAVTAAAGGNMIFFTGGALAAGTSCTIAVDVISATLGDHPNATETVTSSLGTSEAAEATLSVAAVAPGFVRVFSPDTIRQNGETEIVFTIDNRVNAIGITGIAFADVLPSGVLVVNTPGIANNCGGIFLPGPGATTLRFTGGAVAARATRPGTRTSPQIDLRSSLPMMASAAAATLTVEAPGFAKTFSPAAIAQDGVSRLTFTIDNTANVIDLGRSPSRMFSRPG